MRASLNQARYLPFVLISHLRSGTHMLRTALDSHPAIRVQAEPFNSNSRELPYDFEMPSRVILDQWVYPVLPTNIRAAGFVLHTYHPWSLRAFPHLRSNPQWADVWSVLASWPGLHVIVLRRKNGIRRHLSQLVADCRNYWHSWKAERVESVTHLSRLPNRAYIGSEPPVVDPIVVDPDRLIVDLEEIEERYAFAEQRMGHLPRLSLSYEELCEIPDDAFQRAQEFLGVEPRPLSPALHRLEDRSLDHAIANYQQLRQRLHTTPWKHLLDE